MAANGGWGWDVDAFLAAIPASQLRGWIEFSELEPFGPLRDDFRFGRLCSTIATFSGRAKMDDLPTPDDFFPTLAPDALPQANAGDDWSDDDRKAIAKLGLTFEED